MALRTEFQGLYAVTPDGIDTDTLARKVSQAISGGARAVQYRSKSPDAALRREQPITAMSYDEWHEVMGVILDGAFHCVKACLPALRKQGGTIINLGGMSAHIGSKHRAHVMTAKAALVGFSRALAHDLAPDRITANCVVPGAIDTARPATSQKPAHHLTHGTITGERGKPEDVAAMVRFLVGPGGRNVTGQTLHVNAGAYLGS